MDRRHFLQSSIAGVAATAVVAPACRSEAATPPVAVRAEGMQFGARQFTRVEVAGEGGAIGAGNSRTAAAGARVLAKGGNAVDAAIAAAFMAYVVEPANSGLGGHGRLTMHMAKAGRTVGIDHYIRAPRTATPETFMEALRRSGQDTTHISQTGHLAVGVFGTVAGVCAAHERFATMPLPVLMEEAIAAAEVGPPIELDIQLAILGRVEDLENFPRAREALMPGGRVPKVATEMVRGTHGWERSGSRLDTRDLAKTMKRIAKEGASAIYGGSIAEAIDREMREHNGVLTKEDLAAYRPAVFDETLWSYRDHSYSTCSDLLGPQFLNIAEQFDIGALDPNGVDYRHVVAEALALAYTDCLYFPADPADTSAPREGLASKGYGKAQAKRIRMDRAIGSGNYKPGDPWPFETRAHRAASLPGAVAAQFAGTTSICVGDKAGNVVSFITSLGSGFGSLVLVPGTGMFLGNAMQWFDPRPGLANSVAPGRMPPYVAPLMTTYQNGRPIGAIAGAGGYRIASALFHSFLNRVDHRMGIQAALEHPRVQTMGAELLVDERVGGQVIDQLIARGHTVQVCPDAYESSIATPTAVWREKDGAWHAAADPKRGGTAVV
jgi:gamma-glutamyltranspeptidase/glutathione hydrolase